MFVLTLLLAVAILGAFIFKYRTNKTMVILSSAVLVLLLIAGVIFFRYIGQNFAP